MTQLDASQEGLWTAAENLHTNSDYSIYEYYLSVMSLVFRHQPCRRYPSVRSLEGVIQKATAYYEDKRKLIGKVETSKRLVSRTQIILWPYRMKTPKPSPASVEPCRYWTEKAENRFG